jgi:hypothetical protein
MTKPTDDHHTQNTRAEVFKPFETFDRPYANPGFDEPEPAQAAAPMAQRFFSLSHAGKIFGKSPRTMRWWADTGGVRTVKIGSTRFITEAEIQRLQNCGEG